MHVYRKEFIVRHPSSANSEERKATNCFVGAERVDEESGSKEKQQSSNLRTSTGPFEKREGLQELNEFDEVTNKIHQNEEVNNPVVSLVSAGFETANGKHISISEEGHKSVQKIRREFQGNFQETYYENELKDIKARISNKSMESKFRKTANSSAQIANKTNYFQKTSFQVATRKREFQDSLQEQQDKNTGFQTANGKHVLISEKGKKRVEGLLNEFHRSETGGDIENNLLCLKNKIISKKQSMLPQQKTTPFTSSEEDGENIIYRYSRRKREFQDCLQEKHCETELKDVKDRMECKFKKIAKSSAQVDKNTDFQTSSKENEASVSFFTSRNTRTDAVETSSSTRKCLGSRRTFFPRSKK
uniref:Uncharacterized protein n=1 Tax=Glossina morsitans morsitans TaxID=37546 RepID=A0A1B0F9U4_GLOMM